MSMKKSVFQIMVCNQMHFLWVISISYSGAFGQCYYCMVPLYLIFRCIWPVLLLHGTFLSHIPVYLTSAITAWYVSISYSGAFNQCYYCVVRLYLTFRCI